MMQKALRAPIWGQSEKECGCALRCAASIQLRIRPMQAQQRARVASAALNRRAKAWLGMMGQLGAQHEGFGVAARCYCAGRWTVMAGQGNAGQARARLLLRHLFY